MRGGEVRWILVFTPSIVEHLARRDVEPEDAADAVFGRFGVVWVRRRGRGKGERWHVVAPLAGGELLSCVLRMAEPRHVEAAQAFAIGRAGVREDTAAFGPRMRLCVSARISDEDERRGYRRWRRAKGGSR